MGKLSPTDIAFEGVRVARERPRRLLTWAALNLALGLVSSVVIIALAGPEFAQALNASQSADRPDPRTMMSTYSKLLPVFLIIFPLLLTYVGVIAASVYRQSLEPPDASWHGLKFGKDELRQIGLLLILMLLIFCLYLLVAIPTVLLSIVLGILIGVSSGSTGAGVAAIVLCIASGFLIFSYVMVRLSLAGPMTFAQRRIRVFGSWPLTKRRFWPLFGGYLLAGFLILIISLLALMILGGIGVATGGLAGAGAAFNPDYTSFESYFTPALLLSLPVTALINALVAAIQLGAVAEAYWQITTEADGQDPASPAAPEPHATTETPAA